MMCVLLLALLVSQVCCDMNLDVYWMSWKNEFSKNYNSVREEAYRRSIWEQNVLKVRKHNEEAAAGQHTFTTGINHLSDMTTEEVNAKLNGLRVEKFSSEDVNENFTFLGDYPVPSSVNWTEDGFVTPVKNQGECNSCWAFSAVGALEAQMKKKKGRLVPLSVQNLVDCSFEEGNHGCTGGYVTNAFNYIVNQRGISKESVYPYTGKLGNCHANKTYGRCSGFRVLQRYNEFELQKVVANIGPVAVGINASDSTFHHYQTGIYNYTCEGEGVNHAVLVVGYGKEGGQQYWLIKNSWGVDWGEGGYMRLQRNNNNQCGIGTYSVIPIV
ncbi:procathepsin L-like isoform X2 [Hemibagrus wyckioides]|uniref:procathepsin L-like isoform X2 n=1 Tax=Hemibagrus wyckioides TaxID=337641 RepID=UPI00266DACBD|nr:procathepsin L-like isoform X2 [Hemibagrus wyckioides]